jgi:peptide deformylase
MVTRNVSVGVKYQDLDGAVREMEVNDIEARIVQHEQDHLDKVLIRR